MPSSACSNARLTGRCSPRRHRQGIRRVLLRCLEKDPRRRLRDISDARAELDESPIGPDILASAIGRPQHDRDVEFRRLTDFVGMKESPAISPDGKMFDGLIQ
jgi:hypothetical protein